MSTTARESTTPQTKLCTCKHPYSEHHSSGVCTWWKGSRSCDCTAFATKRLKGSTLADRMLQALLLGMFLGLVVVGGVLLLAGITL